MDLRHNKYKREEPTTVIRWLLGALLLNSEVTTFWNMRRELVKSKRLDVVAEFHFVDIVHYHSPKSFEAFAYRRWLVTLIIKSEHLPVKDICDLLRHEIQAVTVAAERYPNNCHAWSHRRFVIKCLEEPWNKYEQLYAILRQDWHDTAKWCERHISDYSGFAYRQFLLQKLVASDSTVQFKYFRKRMQYLEKLMQVIELNLDAFNDPTKDHEDVIADFHNTDFTNERWTNLTRTRLVGLSFWAEECLLNEELIKLYPNHEALWCHRRFLAHSLMGLNFSFRKFQDYRADFLQAQKELGPDERETFFGANQLSKLVIAFRERNRKLLLLRDSPADNFVKFLHSIRFPT